MSTLRLMSQNMWNWIDNTPEWEKDGYDCSSKVRMKGHAQIFKELMPDVVGGQEVNMFMQLDFKLNCIKENLPYTIIWGNMTPIIYRADKLELLDTEYLLYPHNVEGYDGIFNDADSKSANLAVFKSKEDGNVFIFLTTHLWWMFDDPDNARYRKGSGAVRKLQLIMAMDLVDKYKAKSDNCPAFIVGDLNTHYDSEALQYALNERSYSHAHDIATEYAHEGSGYNTCTPLNVGEWTNEPFEKAIDHILVKGTADVNVIRFDRYTPDYYRFLSDHAPVFVDVDFSVK